MHELYMALKEKIQHLLQGEGRDLSGMEKNDYFSIIEEQIKIDKTKTGCDD